MSPLTLLVRARGLTWSIPALLAVVGVGAWCAYALESQQRFDESDRVPAVVLSALAASFLTINCLSTADEELDGATPRLSRATILGLVTGLVALAAITAVICLPVKPFERGGAELARNVAGLTGLGLLGAAIARPALGWTVPFVWTGISYFGVPKVFQAHPDQAAWGWLLFPASYPVTWVVAGALLLSGLLVYAWAGFQPRPLRHPFR